MAKRKYRNQPVTYFGQTFASKREGARYLVLRARQEAGEIAELQCQVPYNLDVYGVHVCRYVADFVYIEDGYEVVEDAKGFRTREYRLKKKLMLALHGIEIQEV